MDKPELFLINLMVLFSGSAIAERQKVISDKNEYRGTTIEITYELGDKQYSNIPKSISYYDSNKKKTKEEYFYTNKFADEKGFNKSIAYYDGNERMKEEGYYINERLLKTNSPHN